MQKQITPFYHAPTNSWSYLLADPASKVCAFIDPVLDFEPGAGTVQHDFITLMLNAAAEAGLQVAWVLETHIHADHVSAADFVRQQTGAQIGIGRGVEQVSALFTPIFNLGEQHPNVRVAFDRLFEPGETLFLGELAGVSDPELKRKTIGRLFIDVFDQEAKAVGGADFLAQGTLYPDVIESVSFTGGPSVTIK